MPTAGSRMTYGGNRAFHNFANDYSHISDPNLRRRLALSDIDTVPLGLYHVRAVAVAGVGFLLDSYDIFAISQVTSLLGMVFWGGGDDNSNSNNANAIATSAYGYYNNGGRLPDPVNQALKAATSAGIIVGQLLFGWLADVFGRRRMYGFELAIIVLSTLGCALACPSPTMTSTGLLVFWRVVMGIGIGGDYPLSSVITSEFAPTRWRGAMMASVFSFSMQGIGQLLSAIVALIVTVAFRADFAGIRDAAACDARCRLAADRAWRIIVGVGALPACFALYYRITIPETPRYTFDVAYDIEKADADIRAYTRLWPAGASHADSSKNNHRVDPLVQARLKRLAGPALAAAGAVPPASWPDLLAYFGTARPLRALLGTTLSWFFLDLAFYGLALNNAVVLEAIGYASGNNLYEVLYNNAVGTIILACAGSLPGYATAIFTIDTVGRKPLQVFGFAILTVLFCVLGFAFHRLDKGAMLGLYIAAQFFFNCGPNTTTFIIPGECFPTRYRSTGHGLSAAMGKLGAILAQIISIPILSRGTTATATSSSSSSSPPWLNRLMQIFALFMLCGTLVSLICIPETKGVTLEVLAGEPPTSYNAGRNGSIGGRHRRHRRLRRRPSASGKNAIRWRPFAGGQPAGFFYPRVRSHRHATFTTISTTRWYHSWWKRLDSRRTWLGHSHIDQVDADDDDGYSEREIHRRRLHQDNLRLTDGIVASPDTGSETTTYNGHHFQPRTDRPGIGRRLFGRRKKKKNDSVGAASASDAPLSPSSRATTALGSDDLDGLFAVLPPPLSPPAAAATVGGGSVFPGWGAGWGRIDRGGQLAARSEDICLQDVGQLLK